MNEKVKENYDAFISYRHAELDQFVAVELHKVLESFRLPKNVKKSENFSGKTKIERVFRDRDELPLSSNLSDPIMQALERSQYLIVICTPRLPQSQWCEREITSFIKMHGRERVFAVLAEGEPNESFPPAILHEERIVKNPDGTEAVEVVDFEPLGADVRGKDQKEIKKKIREEVLRLAAVIFGVAYDDLKQRHRERKLKKIAAVTSVSAGVFLTCGAVSSVQAWKIHQQAEDIKQQYTLIQKSQSVILGEQAKQALAEGDRAQCVQLAKEALPKEVNQQERPIASEALYALTEGLRAYDNGKQLQPKYYLEQEVAITDMQVTPGMDLLLTEDAANVLRVWSPMEKQVLLEVATNRTDLSKEMYTFCGTNLLITAQGDGIAAYDVTTGENVWTVEDNRVYYVCSFKQGEEIAVLANKEGKNCILLYNKTGQLLQEYPVEGQVEHRLAVSPSGDKIAYITNEASKKKVHVLQRSNGKELARFVLQQSILETIKFTDSDTLFGVTLNSGDMEDIESVVECFSVKKKKRQWVRKLRNTVEDVYVLSDSELLVRGSFVLQMLDPKTGKIKRQAKMEREMLHVGLLDNGNFQLCTSDGEIAVLTRDFSSKIEYRGKDETIHSNLKLFVGGDGFYATNVWPEKKVLVYNFEKGQDFSLCLDTRENFTESCVDGEGNRIALISMDSRKVSVWDRQEQKSMYTIETEANITHMEFLGKDTLCVVTDQLNLYDVATGQLKKQAYVNEIAGNSRSWTWQGYSSEKNLLYFTDRESILAVQGDTLTKQAMWQLENVEDKTFISDTGNYYVELCMEEGTLELRNSQDQILVKSITDATGFIQNVVFAPGDTCIFVSYQDGTTVAMNTNLEVIETYEEFSDAIGYCHKIGEDTLVVGNQKEAYILQGDQYSLVGRVCGYLGAVPSQSVFLCGDGTGAIYQVPQYSYTELVAYMKECIYAK